MKQANAKQKQWMSDITEWSISNIDLLYGDDYMGAIPQRHHVLGRSAKHNKVAIGHWFIIPVPFELHDVMSNHPDNVTHRKKSFVKRFGTQRDLFLKMVESMRDDGYELPPTEVLKAIEDTRA